MGKIYVGQTDLRITLKTNTDITGALATKIMYKSPSLIEGELDATIDDAINGIISYIVPNATVLNELGNWTFWAKITSAQNKISISEPSSIIINKQGN